MSYYSTKQKELHLRYSKRKKNNGKLIVQDNIKGRTPDRRSCRPNTSEQYKFVKAKVERERETWSETVDEISCCRIPQLRRIVYRGRREEKTCVKMWFLPRQKDTKTCRGRPYVRKTWYLESAQSAKEIWCICCAVPCFAHSSLLLDQGQYNAALRLALCVHSTHTLGAVLQISCSLIVLITSNILF